MDKYILLYKGPATDADDMSEAESNAVMNKWRAWMDEVGDVLVDIGQPMANGIALMDNGREDSPTRLNGYSIIQASDMESAKHLAGNHPFLDEGDGRFSVEIHQLMPVPM